MGGCDITYADAFKMYELKHMSIKKTPSGNFLYYRNKYNGDVHLIKRPFAHKSLPLAQKEAEYEKTGCKYVA